MGRKNHFLAWDVSVAESVAGHLLAESAGRPPDLSGTLVLVPTRQAGRRLRVALAAASGIGGVVSPVIVTPNSIFEEFGAQCRTADGLSLAAAWTAVMSDIAPHECKNLFPRRKGTAETGWAYSMGCKIDRLRRDLAEGGMTISSLLAAHADCIDDPARWEDLALLEQRYLDRLSACGLLDPCQHAIETARHPLVAPEINKIVVAALPAPTGLLTTLLQNLGVSVDIDILVHADSRLADKFDGWGRLKRDYWSEAVIDIDDPERKIVVVNDPAEQAEAVVEAIAAESAGCGPDDIALGTPDQGVADLVAARLAGEGLATFNPSGAPYAGSPLHVLLEAFASFESDKSLAAFRKLISQPSVLRMFALAGVGDSDEILLELDRVSERHLGREIDDLRAVCKEYPLRYPRLEQVLRKTDEWLSAFSAVGLLEFLREWLAEVYGGQPLPTDAAERAAHEEAAVFVLDSAEAIGATGFGFDSRRGLRLLIQHMRAARRTLEREWPAIDLQGWIELHWEDAPLLIATGMNEGVVPESRVEDIFLPDSRRRELGLVCDRDRLARDVYYMTAICEHRRKQGRAVFVLGRYACGGDPLKPSRLLFHCLPEQVVERAEHIFRAPPEKDRNRAAQTRLRLDPSLPVSPPQSLLPDHLSPSAISDYLACPFRFYLKRILGMEPYKRGKSELDGADYGSLIHLALKSIGPQPERPPLADANVLAGMLEKELRALFRKRYGSDPAVPLLIQLETAVNRLEAFARQQVELWEQGWEIAATERECEIELDGMPVRGVIDRIDRHRESRRLRLIDYKTSESACDPGKYHLGTAKGAREYALEGRGAWKNLQLPLYRMMIPAEMAADAPVEVALWHLPKAVSDSGLLVWDDCEQLLDSARNCACGVIADLRAHRFWPPRERVEYDDFAAVFPRGIAGHIERDAFLEFLGRGSDGED